MKVLMFLRMNDFSGAENVACQIISLLEDKIQFVYASPDGRIRSILKEKGIAYFPLKKNSYAEYKRAIRSVEPDIVHAHDMAASLMAALACGSIPLVLHIHNNAYNARKINLKSVLFRYAANKADKIIWVSDSSFNGYAFHRHYIKKSEIIYNIIDTDTVVEKARESDSSASPYDAIYVGRLTYQKNPQRLVEVLGMVASRKENVKIAIVGNGDMQNEILGLIREKGLEKNIDYLGYINNPYPLIGRSKLLLMTSRWEGTPMVCLEALSLGLPVVSTPVDGIAKIIRHGENGFLSESDEELSEYVLKLITDDALLKAMSDKASESSRAMNDKDKYREQILESYRNCLKGDSQ